MSRRHVVITACVLTAVGVFAQTPSRPAFGAFEVASIKSADPAVPGRWIRMLSANRFEARNHAVRTLIAAAYDLSPQAILGGPAWVDADRWDILAKTPGEVRPNLDEQMAMLRALLRDRFRLAFHRETKELPIYTLTVAKGGAKLTKSAVSPDATPQGPPLLAFVMAPNVIRLPARYVSMAELASVLQRSPLDRPVVDKTDLQGRYDFDLAFSPDERLWGGAVRRPENPDKPDLFDALQEQLGLRLQATKGAVEAFVIESVERASAN